MAVNLTKKLKDFVGNDKPYPFVSTLAVGIYMLAFYYSKNFELGNSWQHLLFFSAYFVLLPAVVTVVVYRLVLRIKKQYAAQSVFVCVMTFFAFFLLEHLSVPYGKRITVALFLVLVALSFRYKNHKPLVLIVMLMTVFPLIQIGQILAVNFTNPRDWDKLPDNIADCRFEQTPNVYFLQMDGYANATALKSKLYQYDNSAFDAWLTQSGFTLYDDFHSNYNSTLKSNSSIFSMMHHYSCENVGFKNASDYVMGENPVLQVFKKNGYQTYFITERPYFLVSRPVVQYDYSNFTLSEVPLLKDGWSSFKDITKTVKSQVAANPGTRKFFFIQKFNPGHIAVSKAQSQGIDGERVAYIQKLEEANVWLKTIIGYIAQHDPNAIVIIGADHGGFVGMEYTGDAFTRITDPDLLRSIFGAKLAIKWNRDDHAQYDTQLKSSVNLFRTLFAALSENTDYLDHIQPNVSYNNYDHNDLRKIYKAIE